MPEDQLDPVFKKFMQTTSEQLLIERIREGDPQAWESCIGKYEGRLQAFVSSRVGDRTLAEDIVQETFLGFLTSLPNYDSKTPLEPFLFSIASHKLTDALRRQGRRPTVSMPGSSSGKPRSLAGPGRAASGLMRSRERVDSEEEFISGVLKGLIKKWKQEGYFERMKCIELLFVRGWTNKATAQFLMIDEQAVANHKQYVLGKLKRN